MPTAEKPKVTWTPKKVKLIELRENLNNPKVLTELGKKHLHQSIDKFGPAGTMVVNKDMTIIDGHSRKQELLDRGYKEVWVSMPDVQLTEDEYKEMNAMYDHARASEMDMFMVGNMFDEALIEEWDLNDDGEPRRKKKNGQELNGDMDHEPEPKYPIIPRYDERYQAIVVICSNEIDLAFIKNALAIDKAMSYKNKTVKETSIITSDQFIKAWKSKS